MNSLSRRRFNAGSLLFAATPVITAGANDERPSSAVQTGEFRWTVGPPLLSAAERPADPCYAVKDPTIVRFGDRWHLFCTIRSQKRTHQIEAQNSGRRYYKAYLADRLDGEWQALAATREKPLASPLNVRDGAEHWTDSFSHGELLRSGYDERLEVDPANLRLLFQGVTDETMRGKKYGEIPWQLGILEAVP